jgi:hypothetical protein
MPVTAGPATQETPASEETLATAYIDAANIMDQGMIMDARNSKANNRNISNSTSKSMDKERAWMPVTVRPTTETLATAQARAWTKKEHGCQ